MRISALAITVGLVGLPALSLAAPDIYGRFDVSLDNRSDYPGSSARSLLSDIPSVLPPGGGLLVDAWELESNSSRIGIRGSEALFDEGLRVIYQYETQIDVDGDGQAFTIRNAFLGLDSGVGKFFAGNYDSVTKLADGDLDQFDDTPADMGAVFLGQHRNNNSLNWQSPSYGGVSLMLQAAPGEADVTGIDVRDGVADTLGASVTFEQDILYAALAYEQGFDEMDFPAPLGAGVGVDTQIARGSIGVSLDNGVAFGAIVEMFELEPLIVGSDKLDGRSWLVGGKFTATDRVTVKAQYSMLDSGDLDTELSVLTVGGEYRLGKQTMMYALASRADTEIGTAAPARIDESGNLLSLGMRHKF